MKVKKKKKKEELKVGKERKWEICRLKPDEPDDFFGQSTKSLN